MTLEIITILIVAVIAFSIAIFILLKIFRAEQQRMLEQINTKRETIDETLKHNKDMVKELVEQINRELEKTEREMVESEKERVGEFSALKTILEEHKIITGELKQSTENLKNILSNNQLRGAFGEEVADNLLRTIGFVKGENYIANTAQDTNFNRPDFTVFLPDKTKINIDVKFPLQALLKYVESDDKLSKEKYLREFSQDVKKKIKDVCSRDYINPEENTVDFMILFVPNEMVFSFIHDNLPDVWNEALSKKVILAGPFSFAAILRMVFQAYKNFKYQENLYDIIRLIKMFENEYEKYNAELDTLGARIKSAAAQYDIVSTTRTKKLSGLVEKIKGEANENNQLDKPAE